jgi:hypothetical protein
MKLINSGRPVRKFLKSLLALLCLGCLVFVSLAFFTNVPTDLTAEDKAVFYSMGIMDTPDNLNFEAQVRMVARLQKEVFKRAPLGEGIEIYVAREPADLMRAGQGLCYDRSRTFDKGSTFLGMEARHVYILYKQDKSFLPALFNRGQQSHAVTEIKTSKGWLFVDSNMPWMAVTRNGEPVSADDVWKRFDEFDNPPLYLKEPWWAIRGMYSRKGHFYKPYILFPEFNWPDFLDWLVFG